MLILKENQIVDYGKKCGKNLLNINSRSATSGLQYFSTGNSNIWLSRLEKDHNPLVTKGDSVSPMTKPSKIFLSC